MPKARSEPIFYNGKTYQLDFGPASGGAYDMVVSGMSSKQKKDAVAVATSALGLLCLPGWAEGQAAERSKLCRFKMADAGQVRLGVRDRVPA